MLGTGIHFQSNQPPSGPPFSAAAAENGTSISTGLGTTPIGKIQLGNLFGDPLQQAALLDTMEIPLNGQQLRFTGGPNDTIIIQNSGLFVFLDNGVSNSQSAISSGIISLSNDDYTTTGPTIQILDVLTLTQVNLDFFNIAGKANFIIEILDGGGFLQSFNKDLMTVSGAIETANPGSGAGFWKLGGVIGAAVALDITKYVEVSINGAVIKLGVVS
jgi:hypothetical protein